MNVGFAKLARMAMAGAFLSMSPAMAMGQGFPARPVSVLIPYPPGGPIDVQARIVAPDLGRQLGQPVVLDNRAGGGGKVAMDALARAPKDGYLLALINGPVVVIYPLLSGQKLEPVKDYAPVAPVSDSYAVIVAHPSVPYRDIRGLVSFARANPGRVNAGNSGIGTGGHLVMEMLKYVTGVEVTIVSYKGAAPAMADLLAGRIHTTLTVEGAKQHVDSGRLVALATTGPRRWEQFPGVPTLLESGLSDMLTWSSWLGLAAPAGVAPEVLARLNRAAGAAIGNPDIRRRFEEQGLIAQSGSAEEFTGFIRAEADRLGKVIRAANIRLD